MIYYKINLADLKLDIEMPPHLNKCCIFCIFDIFLLLLQLWEEGQPCSVALPTISSSAGRHGLETKGQTRVASPRGSSVQPMGSGPLWVTSELPWCGPRPDVVHACLLSVEQSQWMNATGLFCLIHFIICRIMYRKYAKYGEKYAKYVI
jgi:hypothetical protein